MCLNYKPVIPKRFPCCGAALRLRRICDSDEKCDERSEEYQKYLISRDYQPVSVKRQFEEVKKLSRSEARRPKVKSNQ